MIDAPPRFKECNGYVQVNPGGSNFSHFIVESEIPLERNVFEQLQGAPKLPTPQDSKLGLHSRRILDLMKSLALDCRNRNHELSP